MTTVGWGNNNISKYEKPALQVTEIMAILYKPDYSEKDIPALINGEKTLHTVYSTIIESPEQTTIRKAQAQVLRNTLNKIKAEQKWLGKAWDVTKIGFADKDSSANVESMINAYENYDGVTFEQAFNTLKSYAEGQEQVIDVTADVAGGLAAFGCYAYAMGGAVAAPFTGGASATQIGVGIGFAGTASAAVRTAIKGTNLENYSWQEQLKDVGKGYTDGLIAPLAAGAEYGITKGLANAGLPAAQRAVSAIENQVVVGFGKATTKNTVIEAADYLANQAAKNGANIVRTTGKETLPLAHGITVPTKEAMKSAATSEVRKTGQVIFQNISRQGVQQATTLTENALAQSAARTAAKPLIEGPTVSLAQKLLLNTARGTTGGATFGGIKGGSDYTLDSWANATPWTLFGFLGHTGAGTLGGAVAGGALSSGGTLVSEGLKNIIPASTPNIPISQTTQSTLTDSVVPKTEMLPVPKPAFGSLTIPASAPLTGNGALTSLAGTAGTSGALTKSPVTSETAPVSIPVEPTGKNSFEKPVINTKQAETLPIETASSKFLKELPKNAQFHSYPTEIQKQILNAVNVISKWKTSVNINSFISRLVTNNPDARAVSLMLRKADRIIDYVRAKIDANKLSNIDNKNKEIFFENLALMFSLNKVSFFNLVKSKGFKEILNGNLSFDYIKDIKPTDKIGENHFYELFEQIEKQTDIRLSKIEGLDKQLAAQIIKLGDEYICKSPNQLEDFLSLLEHQKDIGLTNRILNFIIQEAKKDKSINIFGLTKDFLISASNEPKTMTKVFDFWENRIAKNDRPFNMFHDYCALKDNRINDDLFNESFKNKNLA